MCPGVILYQGASQLVPEIDISVVVIFGSKNRKTGHCNQVYFLPTDTLPSLSVIRTVTTTPTSNFTLDTAVCGDCPLKPSAGHCCYVTLGHGPNRVWKSMQRGNYPIYAELTTSPKGMVVQKYVDFMLSNYMNRIGTWGDIASCPDPEVLQKLTATRRNWTGYTHQWMYPQHQHLQETMMASTHSEENYHHAKDLGFRSYRTKVPEAPLLPNEIMCPYPKVTCSQCKLCSGNALSGKDIAIDIHGVDYKQKNFKKSVKELSNAIYTS